MYLISDGGVSSNTPDTIESVLLTKNISKLDGVKLDVRLSLDNVFVISRYEELDKFTYARGNVSDYKYSYLRKVKFPSHIFKYYIPTLEEILKSYSKDKIIVLEIYSTNNLDELYNLLTKYNYKYCFYSKNKSILNKLSDLLFDKIGILLNNSNLILKDLNTFLIKQ